MRWFLVRIWLAVIVCITFVRTEVTVENGGFGNVLVSFSSNVPSDGSKMLLDSLEASLKKTSEILSNSIGLRISKVTFILPKAWDTSSSEWENVNVETSSHKGSKSDILVDDVHDSVFGKLPLALQYGSCRTPGRQIIVPADFLTDENSPFPKGTALAREWLKYRYGVFDENGYAGDELYPLYYTVPGGDPSNLIVTHCSNKHITYNFIDTEGNNCTDEQLHEKGEAKCRTDPTEESLENVTSSLMYFHEKISRMEHVCGKDPEHSHSSLSRNKHNAFCGGQSIWDILKNSIDFQSPSFSRAADADGEENIEFSYVKEPDLKVVIALDITKNLEEQGETSRTAIKRFVYDLPKGSKYYLLPYTDNVIKGGFSLRALNNYPGDWQPEILGSFDKEVDACVTCAIEKALEILAADNPSVPEPEGTIIIISGSPIKFDEDLRKKLENPKICLMFLVLSSGATLDEYKQYISDLPCGTLEEFSKADKNVTVFEEIFSAMESILPATVDDNATETIKTESIPGNTSTSFLVDTTMQKITFWIFPNKASDARQVTFDNEIVEVQEEITTADILALSYYPKQEGMIQLTNVYGKEILTQIRATSKPGEYFSGEVFIHDTTSEGSEIQMPVILYARVRFGAYPVQNAEVQATVSRPNEEDVKLMMYDNGSGDPDITANDGIYSRYFTRFNEEGEYTVTVTVNNNGRLTSGGKHSSKGYESCCGRNVEKGTLELPEFTKTFTTTFKAVSRRPDEGYKPSRIVDLRIDSVTEDQVVLTWTAPGAEADEGTATKYEMKLFCEGGENATECDLNKMIRVLEEPTPMNYGTKQKVTTQILDKSLTLLIGIVTLNGNHESDLSNTIQISRSSTGPLEITTTNPDPNNESQASPVGIIVGSTIAGLIVLLCIIIAITYFCKRKGRNEHIEANDIDMNINRSNQQKNISKVSTHSVNGSPMRRVESFPVLLYTHDQLKDFKDKGRNPPLYKTGVPPKPWVSLDVLSNRKGRENLDGDAKSLGSLSTVHVHSSSETNESKTS